jgi:hypothetical protein
VLDSQKFVPCRKEGQSTQGAANRVLAQSITVMKAVEVQDRVRRCSCEDSSITGNNMCTGRGNTETQPRGRRKLVD